MRWHKYARASSKVAACVREADMNQLDLRQRVAVITGGARGLRYAVAGRGLRSGGSVSLWDIDAAHLKLAGDRLTAIGEVDTCIAEVTREDAVEAATQGVL